MMVVKNVLRFLVILGLFITFIYIYSAQSFIKFEWGKVDIHIGGTTFTNCYGIKIKDAVVFGRCFVSSSFAGQR